MNLFDLAAKLTLDTKDYKKGLNDAQEETQSKASKIGSLLKGAVGTVAKVSAAATVAAGTAISKIVKDSVDAYGNYEQLVGGVETLFGKSASRVLEDSRNAFKTAGMSMNEYMETSIQSAASLINSLGGDQEKAARLMNMSITDMADNVNKMGTSMESVQNAYRGFSRGNFMMLDNLALGFAGTKQGMEELLKKAQEISGVKYDISNYADIVEAIHVVQTEMGITGTTAKEASTTIQGSLSSVKSAWQNLMIGLSDSNADIGKLVENLVSSAGTFAGNVIPVIKQALIGIGATVETIAPELAKGISSLVVDVLPDLGKSALVLVTEFGNALLDNIEPLLNTAIQLIVDLVKMLTDSNAVAKLIDAAFFIISTLGESLYENLPVLLPMITSIITTIAERLLDPDNVLTLAEAALRILEALAFGLFDSLSIVAEKGPEIIKGLVEAIIRAAPFMLDSALVILEKLGEGIRMYLKYIWDVGKAIVQGIWQGITNSLDWIKTRIKGWVGNVMAFIKGLFGIHSPSKWAETIIGKNIALGMAEGILDNEDAVEDAMNSLTSGVSEDAMLALGAGIPSTDIVTEESILNDGRGNASAQILSLLNYYLPTLASMKIMLDSGTLVGELAPGMDAALGRRAVYASRGMA